MSLCVCDCVKDFVRTYSDEKLKVVFFRCDLCVCDYRHAQMEIPELGLQTYPRVYQHKCDLLFHHVAQVLESTQVTAENIKPALDVEHPFTVIVDDPSGFSTFSNMEHVMISDIVSEDPEAVVDT